MTILGAQSLDQLSLLEIGVDPSVSPGVPASIGTVAMSSVGVYQKTGSLDTDWKLVPNSTQIAASFAPLVHTHVLADVTDVNITAANLNALDDGINTALHFHDADRARANHTGTQVAATISDFATAADARITAQKGVALGLATLDASGRLPAAQLTVSAIEYKGVWNASTNTPTLSDATGTTGDMYRVSVAGSQNLGSGVIAYEVGDYAIHNGTAFEKSDTTDAVSSVNGFTGAVNLTTTNVAEGTNLYYTSERAQDDALGALVALDSTSIDFTYNDAGNSVTAAVLPAGVDKNLLGGSALTIAKGGTGQITANAAFAALSPMTTLGDLITRDGTVPVRLALGADQTFLKATPTGPVWSYVQPSPRRKITINEDWLSGTVAGNGAWTASVAGTSATITALASAGRYGIIQATTGTTATGRASIVQSTLVSEFINGDGESTIQWCVQVPVLSTALQEFTVRVGFGDVVAAGDFVDGMYFEYNRALSVNWTAVTAANSVRTRVASTVAVTAGGYVWLKAVTNAAGTSVEFFINDVSVATITTNIPVGVARAFVPICKLEKSVGTTASLLRIDACYVDKYFNTIR